MHRVAPVHAEIGGQTVRYAEVGLEGFGEGESRAVHEIEAHLPPRQAWQVVLEKEFERKALVGGTSLPSSPRLRLVVEQFFLSLHQREACPRLDALHKFAVEAQADTCGVAHGIVVGQVAYAQVVDLVGDKVGYVLIIYVGGEFERLVPQPQVPVEGAAYLIRFL